MFPKIHLELGDIISSWAGLRPLIHEEGRSTSERSRKDKILTSDTGLLSLAGGKLTGYRKMAERAVNRIAKRMEEERGMHAKPRTTDRIPLCGNGFKKHKQVKSYIATVLDRFQDSGFTPYDAWYLVTTYGKQTQTILELHSQVEDGDPHRRMIRAEVRFAIAHERALYPLDFFIGRTGRMYFDIESVRKYREVVHGEFQEAFKYKQDEMESLNRALDESLKSHSDFSLDRE